MKKTTLFIAALLLGSLNPLAAQTTGDDNEITVTTENGDKEVIDLPEALTNDYDSLLNDYNARTYLKANPDCNLPNVNPTFTADEYKERLAQLPSIIEMPYNDVVRKFIDRYSGRLRHSVSIMLGMQNFYMPTFEEALEAYGLPLELKYLPVIESGLNPNAVSHAGATGLWQFMLKTAKQYGLEINSLVDERRDPVKASYAAARYLRDLYKIFGDWNLVIAAYNCGPENINKAMHRSKGETDYWKIYPYLPRETRGYVPAFIAANYIMNFYCEHNICPMVADLPAKTDTIVVNRNVHFEQIAGVLGISVDQVRQLNPQYRRNIVNGNSQPSALRLPSNYISNFIDNEPEIYAYRADALLTRRAEVEVTENTPSYTPRSKKNTRSKSTRNKKNKRNRGGKSVTIREGDTLSEIAARHGTTVKKLRQLNGITGSNIRAGRKIKVR